MTFYSDSAVKTMYFDPVSYVPGVRATFELDAQQVAYLPNMRLLNIGSKTNGGATYNGLVGALGFIRNIRLLDGKTELSALNQAGVYRAFINSNKRNDEIASVTSVLHRSELGFHASLDGIDQQATPINNQLSAAATLDEDSNAGYLDLRDCCPLLASLSHLPTSLFPNLRLEIVYESNPNLVNLVSPDNTVMSGIRPTLACDVLQNPTIVAKLDRGLQNATWLEIEHDRFRIPRTATNGGAGDQGVVQATNVKINGFNNKRIQRLLLVKQLASATAFVSGNAVSGWGQYASQNLYEQTLQIRVNGGNIFPRSGLRGSNERLASLCDNFGEMIAYPGSTTQGVDVSNIFTTTNAFSGQLDFDGVLVGQYINDLQINIGRTGTQATNAVKPNTDNINVHVFGEVMKSLVIRKGGGYNITYVQ